MPHGSSRKPTPASTGLGKYHHIGDYARPVGPIPPHSTRTKTALEKSRPDKPVWPSSSSGAGTVAQHSEQSELFEELAVHRPPAKQ